MLGRSHDFAEALSTISPNVYNAHSAENLGYSRTI